MADNILPVSWASCGDLFLPNAIVLPGTFPYPGIYWQECVDSLGETDARISADQNSAAEICYYTQMDTITTPQVNEIFFTSVLGGYAYDGNKYPPLQHPYLPGFFAKDIVSITAVSPEEKRLNSNVHRPQYYEEYNLVKVKVSYETLNYNPCNSGSSAPGWTTVRFFTSNSRITQLFGGYVMEDGSTSGLPWKLGNQLIRPEGSVSITYVHTPSAWYLPALATLTSLQGKVNNALWHGFPAGTLLYDSATIDQPWRNWSNKLVANVVANFIFLSWPDGTGWNNQPKYKPGDDMTTTWPVVSLVGHNPPFAGGDFSQFDTLLVPTAHTVPCGSL